MPKKSPTSKREGAKALMVVEYVTAFELLIPQVL